MNGGDAKLRLAVENPNDEWDEANFGDDGVLYKAESGGDYSYRGDDPASYDEIFDQETDTDEEKFGPLTEFLKFINQSDDATFAADLDEHLDIDAFATLPRRPGARVEHRRHRRAGQQLLPPLRRVDEAA